MRRPSPSQLQVPLRPRDTGSDARSATNPGEHRRSNGGARLAEGTGAGGYPMAPRPTARGRERQRIARVLRDRIERIPCQLIPLLGPEP